MASYLAPAPGTLLCALLLLGVPLLPGYLLEYGEWGEKDTLRVIHTRLPSLMSRLFLRTLHVLYHFILKGSKLYNYHHFTDMSAEIKRD